jgi:urease accessory protein
MTHSHQRHAVGALLLVVCGLAQAHPGHASAAVDGLLHPWLGLDHLLAMVGVGWWATQLGGKARVLLPLTFVGVMALGMAAAVAGAVLPWREAGAAWSVLALGALIACAWRAPLAGAVLCVGLFALAHGAAHGAGLPPQPETLAFAACVLVSTALLHAIGLGCASALAARAHWVRAGGVLLAAGGAYLIVA